jgi:A/G-specific adenine glycosylase
LLEKRPPAGIWGGLWCLPEGEDAESVGESLGLSLTNSRALPGIVHRLSHVRMSINPALATAKDARQVRCSSRLAWCDREQQQALGLPKPVYDLLARLDNGEFT